MKFLDDVIPFTTDLISFGSVHFLAVEDGIVWIQDASWMAKLHDGSGPWAMGTILSYTYTNLPYKVNYACGYSIHPN